MKWFLRRAALLTVMLALAVTAIGTAVAQVSKPLTVAVLTFSNSSGVGGALLGNSASAAAETQFIGSTRYDVVKKETVVKTMADLLLTYPLGRTGIQQLATALEADSVITGDVVKVVKDPKTGQVKLTLRLEMTDRSSGELVNGAIVTGESGTHPGFTGSEDVLLDEALNKAAFAAVRSMTERILPEGTVYATSSREGQIEALLNIGSNSGVRQGMEFIILRNREQVGRLQITSVSPTDSTAAVIATTRGVQPEDKVRAVFRLENIPVDLGGTGASKATIRRPKLSFTNLVTGAAMLFGLWKINTGNQSAGGKGARSVTAAPSGPYNGAPASDTMPDVPIIHLKLTPPIGVKESDVLGYFVYKDNDTQNPQELLGSGGRDAYISAVAILGNFKVSGGTASPLDTTGSHSDGPDVGRPMRFLVRTPYFVSTTTTTGTTTATVALAQEVYTGLVTFLLPPVVNSATTTDITNVTFSFQGVPGGDHYIVQVSDNLSFTNAESFPNGQGRAVSPLPSVGPLAVFLDKATAVVSVNPFVTTWATDPTYTQTITANLQTGSIDPTVPGRVLYWRVGVRDSRDTQLPENGGWVWGTPVQLATATAGNTMKSVSGRHMGGGPLRPRQPKQDPTTLDPTTGSMGRVGRGR